MGWLWYVIQSYIIQAVTGYLVQIADTTQLIIVKNYNKFPSWLLSVYMQSDISISKYELYNDWRSHSLMLTSICQMLYNIHLKSLSSAVYWVLGNEWILQVLFAPVMSAGQCLVQCWFLHLICLYWLRTWSAQSQQTRLVWGAWEERAAAPHQDDRWWVALHCPQCWPGPGCLTKQTHAPQHFTAAIIITG